MTIKELVEVLDAEVLTPELSLDLEVKGGYVSDLLSDVMAHAKEGDLWITLQTHLNIVAVASLKSVSGIVVVNNRRPGAETLKKAVEEGIPILTTPHTSFEIAGRLYQFLNAEKV